MTSRQFYYPRVVLQFYHSMTSRGVPSPLELRFSIDGRREYSKLRTFQLPWGCQQSWKILEDTGIGPSHHRERWSVMLLETLQRDPYSSAGSFNLRCSLWTTCSEPAYSHCTIMFSAGEPYSRPCTGSQRDSGSVPLSLL